MSATICWRAVEPKPKSLGVNAPSSFMQSMERAFGSRPWRLGSGCVPTLLGMAATEQSNDNPYERLIELIERHDVIEVWPEY